MSDGFRKVNLRDIAEVSWSKEGRVGYGKQISEALGRKPESTDIMERHPFDVEVLRVPPGAIPYRYHSHSAQWEFYYIMSGSGSVRHADGTAPISAGDAFLFKPGEAHQLVNDGAEDLVVIVVADNPIGEFYHYPDEKMWIVNSPERRYVSLHPERESDAHTSR
ncbi:MAG: cupin domain-containing protein [Candidatus Eremiobacteraeota bacterium]|nr:cupin domain-containing protein [Candidatus Eremiobacteraeota bacterium]MBC5826753.1 cupin domain-containing protein [Candidatus Eremiobacteraeota bacterium]